LGSKTARYQTEAEAADFLGLAQKTLSRWRWAGKGPAYRKFGGSVRYSIDDLEAFAAAAVVERHRTSKEIARAV
jgi:predicted site-specific integrase-resolvase